MVKDCGLPFFFFVNRKEETELQRGVPIPLTSKKRKQRERKSPAWKNESAIWQLEFILIFSSGEPLAINSDTELVCALSLHIS